jgi:Lrp/AsnC family transcriptional regulator, leucine-responsive regulatory protein
MAFEADGARIDELDWRILEELQADGRVSYTELGRRVSLTAPAIAERVRRLEESGVIRGFHADVDAARVGFPITAFVRWTSSGPDCSHLGEVAKEIPEIVECNRVTGDESYVLKILARSVGHLETLIDGLMPYGSTVTSVVLSSPVVHRPIGSMDRDAKHERGARTPAAKVGA